jgi:hypothetical protein
MPTMNRLSSIEFFAPFSLPSFEETLPAGVYDIETELSAPVGHIDPATWKAAVLVNLHPRASHPGLARTLVRSVDRRLAVDVDLFSSGGLAILKKIRRQNYDVLSRRPTIGKLGRLLLLARALRRNIFAHGAAESSPRSSAA